MMLCTFCSKQLFKTNPKTVKHFCNFKCYGLWQRGKTHIQQGRTNTRPKRFCVYPNCSERHSAKGFCHKHYMQLIHSPKTSETKIINNSYVCVFCETSFKAYHKNPKYCSRFCASKHRRKPFILKKGYKKLLIPGHHRADSKGYVFEHIVIMEQFLNRKIFIGEEIHHKDFDRQNNNLTNLILCNNHDEHMKFHRLPCQANEICPQSGPIGGPNLPPQEPPKDSQYFPNGS